MAIGSYRSATGIRPYEKSSGLLQNQEATTYQYLEAIRQSMANSSREPKRNGYLPGTNARAGSGSRRFPSRGKQIRTTSGREPGRRIPQEDPSKRTDKGKSSHASFAGSQVTLHETVDRKETTRDQVAPLAITKHLCVLDKFGKKKATYE
jgi:hypothetical protein